MFIYHLCYLIASYKNVNHVDFENYYQIYYAFLFQFFYFIILFNLECFVVHRYFKLKHLTLVTFFAKYRSITSDMEVIRYQILAWFFLAKSKVMKYIWCYPIRWRFHPLDTGTRGGKFIGRNWTVSLRFSRSGHITLRTLSLTAIKPVTFQN